MTRLAIALAALVCVAAPQAAQQSFRAATHAVGLDVAVFSGDRAVTSLGLDDFEVYDNDVRQKITSVDRNVLPINLRLVFDTSGSISAADLEKHRQAMTMLTAALGPEDRYEIVTFSGRIAEAASGQRAGGTIALQRGDQYGTSFFDAVSLAMITTPMLDRRQITIVLSDAHDNVSFFDEPTLLEAARRTDAVVYAIMPVESPMAGVLVPRLEALTVLTGGRVIQAPRPDRIGRLMIAALEEFRQSYVLRYTLSGVPTPGWHKLTVRLRGNPSYTVRARQGYVGR
jgi:VWFA-related protein